MAVSCLERGNLSRIALKKYYKENFKAFKIVLLAGYCRMSCKYFEHLMPLTLAAKNIFVQEKCDIMQFEFHYLAG